MIPIFIGYDPTEAIAYHTCVNSIIRYSSIPLAITPLALPHLKKLQGYNAHLAAGSNQFTYSRFFIPELMNYNGWAIYMDGDMIIKEDIANLWKLKDYKSAVMVVKHDYKTKSSIKYLGAKNEDYPRKNWSSVVLWNCGHIKNKMLHTYKTIELHRFEWLNYDEIGSLPVEWNWLVDEYGPNDNAKLIHYTLGTPCFNECATGPMTDEWHKERILTNYAKQI
jgi:lipopolysaccharide biosynthesis glycosyltransferase